jgi:hypothetical protein
MVTPGPPKKTPGAVAVTMMGTVLCGVKTSVAAAPAVMWPLTNAMI